MEILKSVWENEEKTAMTVWFSDEACQNLPFGINPLVPDESQIYNTIVEMYRNGDFTPDPYAEPAIETDIVARDARRERNKLLSDTDYLLSPDYPISDADREAVRIYRQALRDITTQDGFPLDIVWPDKPEVVK